MARKLRYIVIDPETNSIVLQKGAHEPAHPASLTKMMTLAMAFEAIAHNRTQFNLNSDIKIPKQGIPKALAQFETFKPGKSYNAEILLAAAGNKSEARSTVAIAHHLAEKDVYDWGKNENERAKRFLDHTNNRLKEIGLTNTDTHVLTGWKNSRHQTTARDIAVLMDYIQTNFPNTAEIALGQPIAKTLNPFTRRNPVHSSRLLVARPEKVLWAKTGYLREHGFSQGVYYEKDGEPLIAVVLGARTKGQSNRVTLDILSKAYKKLEDNAYKPKSDYKDVQFNPDELLPGEEKRIPVPLANPNKEDNIDIPVPQERPDINEAFTKAYDIPIPTPRTEGLSGDFNKDPQDDTPAPAQKPKETDISLQPTKKP